MPEHYALSKSNEHYTPAIYIQAVRDVLGTIHLDPASNEFANLTVGAETIMTEADTGANYALARRWWGNVFLNPPYGRNQEWGGWNTQQWPSKLIREWDKGRVENAILLVTAATSEQWFRPLWSFPICFTDHRIQFYGADGQVKKGNTKGSAFVLLTHSPLIIDLFRQRFRWFDKEKDLGGAIVEATYDHLGGCHADA